jgi:hypothetical protein
MFFKIYTMVSQLLHKEVKPNSKVTLVYEYYDYDYARLYELV